MTPETVLHRWVAEQSRRHPELQVSFLVSHEYTHHVHRHLPADAGDGTWTELAQDLASGGMYRQAQELDADAFAIYLGLGNFVRGAGRQGALSQLGRPRLRDLEADALLLKCFFLSMTSIFCALWRGNIRIASIWDVSHPPAPVRIEYAIRVAKMWCKQNQSVPQPWLESGRFREVFRAAVDAVGGTTPQEWDDHIKFLTSEEGSKYNESLLGRYELLRTGKESSPEPAVAR
jgi:hypothetical protein